MYRRLTWASARVREVEARGHVGERPVAVDEGGDGNAAGRSLRVAQLRELLEAGLLGADLLREIAPLAEQLVEAAVDALCESGGESFTELPKKDKFRFKDADGYLAALEKQLDQVR